MYRQRLRQMDEARRGVEETLQMAVAQELFLRRLLDR